MTAYLQPGCRLYQIDFTYRNERITFSSGETTKAAARQKETAKRQELALEHAAREAARQAQLAGLPPPEHVLHAHVGRYHANQIAKEYWETQGWDTENASALEGQIERVLDLIGPTRDMATLDDFAMLKFKTKLKDKGPKGWSRKKGEYAPSSINDILRLIFRLYNFARDIRHCCMLYDLHPNQWLEPEPINTREMGYFEEMRLEAVCMKRRPDLIPVYRFGILSAVRREALCTLTWGQLDPWLKRITVDLKGRGKQKKRHPVPLCEEALAILDQMQGHHPKYVFTIRLEKDTYIDGEIVKAGTRIPLKPKTFADLMREMFDEAGLYDLSVVHLRHTGATRLLRACGNKDIVRRFLGHITMKCTDRYAAMVDADLEGALMLLEGMHVAARKNALKALRQPTDGDLKESLEILNAFDAKARNNAKQQLRLNARAAAFAYATAA
jgi:integrase